MPPDLVLVWMLQIHCTGSILSIIRSDLIPAGFEFFAESDVLRKKNDDRNRPISDPSVRGETDRVVVKFRKSAS